MAHSKLKRCPFCGAKGCYRQTESNRMWTAGCSHGHAISPDMETAKEAAEWWNRRYRKSTARLKPAKAPLGKRIDKSPMISVLDLIGNRPDLDLNKLTGLTFRTVSEIVATEPEPIRADQFRCDVCHGVFQKGWSDSEAEADCTRLFGPIALSERGTACEDCWKEMAAFYGWDTGEAV